MRERYAGRWPQLVWGILLVVLAIYSFANPLGVLTGAVMAYGIAALLMGIFDIALYCKLERHTGFGPTLSLVAGILSVLVGILLIAYPGAGSWAVVVLFPLWFIAHCVSQLCRLPLMRLAVGNGYYYFSLVINIIGLILGFIMIFSPGLSMAYLSALMGIYLMLFGLECLIGFFGSRNNL